MIKANTESRGLRLPAFLLRGAVPAAMRKNKKGVDKYRGGVYNELRKRYPHGVYGY